MIFLLRLVMAVGFGSLGNFLAKSSVPPNAPIHVPVWTGMAATLVFALTGFLLPDIVSFLAKAGTIRLAQELGKLIPGQIPRTSIKLGWRKKSDKPAKNPIILDTSAIIDGRIFEIAKTGFLMGTLIVIPSVVGELQHLADSADDLKRARGRMGLDLLNKLRKDKLAKLKFIATDPKGASVDEKLVQIGKKIEGAILTSDFNLGKVANLANLQVLNVNQLAQSLRLQVIPGEEFKITLVHGGKTKSQGVGYLSDGTMVVVEDGGKFIGETIQIKVHRSLQTVAGKMVFARTSSSA